MNILKNHKRASYWEEKKKLRQSEINRYMWNEKEGFFFDYDFVAKKQSSFYSLAGFTPLWAGSATEAQASLMVKQLKRFTTPHGLVITDNGSLAPSMSLSSIPGPYRKAITAVLYPKQWDYPNNWPPLEYLTVIGLLRYGFLEQAKKIMKSSVKTHAAIFRKHNSFYEKINGVTGNVSENYHYKVQSGFGWTNAIFYRYIQILDALDKGHKIYNDTPTTPPFSFSIAH